MKCEGIATDSAGNVYILVRHEEGRFGQDCGLLMLEASTNKIVQLFGLGEDLGCNLTVTPDGQHLFMTDHDELWHWQAPFHYPNGQRVAEKDCNMSVWFADNEK
jgi:hypothetical protein